MTMSSPGSPLFTPAPMLRQGRSKLDLRPSLFDSQIIDLEATNDPGTPSSVISTDSSVSRGRRSFIPALDTKAIEKARKISASYRDLSDHEDNPLVVYLPRGGCQVVTALGNVQVGSPPETVKDSINLGLRPPTHLVLPHVLFDAKAGINVSEVEFPAYYNFFLLKKKLTVIGTEEQAERIRAVFQETAMGPKHIDISQEFSPDAPEDDVPFLADELAHFRRNAFNGIDDLLTFQCFDEDGVAKLSEEVSVKADRDSSMYHFIENGNCIASVSSYVEAPVNPLTRRQSVAPAKNFKPPKFGVTVLGSSHGFDATSSTTGFVIWVNGRGIVVDPPLNTAAILHAGGIPSRLVDSVLLTHCHADHDAGIMQKLLEEKQLQLYTTPTIMESFVRKYEAILADDGVDVRGLFVFRPVTLGVPMRIKGAEFRFHYSVHSIPTIGFQVYLLGKSLFYSSDTCNIPEVFDAMYDAGRMPRGRYNFFKNFSWHHNVIIHEAGVPPIHTPATRLAELPDDVKKRLHLVHIAEKDLPPDKGLKIARVGVENTINIIGTDSQGSLQEAIEVLDVLEESGILHMMSAHQAKEVLQVAKKSTYEANSIIFNQGDKGTEVFIIVSGVVRLNISTDDSDGVCFVKECISGDFFGEMALITQEPRSATAVAVSDTVLLCFEFNDFVSLCRGDAGAMKRLMHLVEIRSYGSYQAMMYNSVLSDFSGHQKTELQYAMQRKNAAVGEEIWAEGDEATSVILVSSGQFTVEQDDHEGNVREQKCECGGLLGNISNVISGGKRFSTVRCSSAGERAKDNMATYFQIDKDDLRAFLDSNPGVRLLLNAIGRDAPQPYNDLRNTTSK